MNLLIDCLCQLPITMADEGEKRKEERKKKTHQWMAGLTHSWRAFAYDRSKRVAPQKGYTWSNTPKYFLKIKNFRTNDNIYFFHRLQTFPSLLSPMRKRRVECIVCTHKDQTPSSIPPKQKPKKERSNKSPSIVCINQNWRWRRLISRRGVGYCGNVAKVRFGFEWIRSFVAPVQVPKRSRFVSRLLDWGGKRRKEGVCMPESNIFFWLGKPRLRKRKPPKEVFDIHSYLGSPIFAFRFRFLSEKKKKGLHTTQIWYSHTISI